MRKGSSNSAKQSITPISIASYSGAKQWFLPHSSRYFESNRCQTLIEPFAGSAITGFSLLYAGLIQRLLLVEKDERIACMLDGIVNDSNIARRYAGFTCTRENIESLFRSERSAFRYLVQSRVCNRGRFDGGLRNPVDRRWARDMVVTNILRLQTLRHRITVVHVTSDDDLMALMRAHSGDPSIGCFADPPYTSQHNCGGHSLYRHRFGGRQKHQKLFSVLAAWRGPWLLTEDNCRTVRRLAHAYRFKLKRVRMNSAENRWKKELVIWRKHRIF